MGVHVEVDRVHVQGSTVGGTDLWRETVPRRVRRRPRRGRGAGRPRRRPARAHPRGPPARRARDRGARLRGARRHGRHLPRPRLGRRRRRQGRARRARRGRADRGQRRHLLRLPPRRPVRGPRPAQRPLLHRRRVLRGRVRGRQRPGRQRRDLPRRRRRAGDLAHLHVQADGPECWCGRHGCLNSVVRVQELLVRAGLRDADQAAELVVTDPEQAVSLLVEGAGRASPPSGTRSSRRVPRSAAPWTTSSAR